jgi:hypothetical protein
MNSGGAAAAVSLSGTVKVTKPEQHRGRTGPRLRQKDCDQPVGKGERVDRRDGLLGGPPSRGRQSVHNGNPGYCGHRTHIALPSNGPAVSKGDSYPLAHIRTCSYAKTTAR